MKELIIFIWDHNALIIRETLKHLQLVGISVFCGLIISLPLGVILSRHRILAKYVLAVIGTIQTIPGLVLLGFAMLLFGIGVRPALIVLTIYSILPTLRNTYTGITEVDAGCKESAKGIGMSNPQILFKIELPLALPSIVNGFRISTIYIVNWATLAGLVGAGGLGDLIWTGLATYENNFILTGAILAAIMAMALGALIGAVQKLLTPRGMRVGRYPNAT